MISVSRPADRGFRLYREGSSTWIFSFASSLLSELQKNCPEGTIAIVHDDDLELVKDMVRLSPTQNIGLNFWKPTATHATGNLYCRRSREFFTQQSNPSAR